MLARTMDDVLRDLDEIIDYSRKNNWGIGYFAALYHHVAIGFKHAIDHHAFHDSKRIERLDIVFFDRFLTAVDTHRHGGKPSKSWQIAFEAAQQWRPTVMTNLLLGMNAHIDFDLGIAVAEVVPADDFNGFEPDYNKMNELLSSLLAVIEDDLARIWPWLGWLHRLLGKVEDGIINFSMREARKHAWNNAVKLVKLSTDERRAKIDEMDDVTHGIGWLILHPGILINAVFLLMRLEQHGSVARLIDILLSDRAHGRMQRAIASTVGQWEAPTNE